MKPIRDGMIACLVCLSAAACSHEVKPDAMTAEQHRAVAAKEERQAQGAIAKVTGQTPWQNPQNIGREPELYINPDATDTFTQEQLSRARHLQEQAREHEQAAAQLEQAEDAQCKPVPPTQRPTCPVLGPVSKVSDIEGGVRIQLGGRATSYDLLPLVRCHYAYARAHGPTQGKACAIYVPGAEFRDSDDPRTIDIVGKDRKTTDEIRKRAHAGAFGPVG